MKNGTHTKQGLIIIILILIAIPYFTALQHGFVYDDHGSIEENPFLQNVSNISRVITLQTITDNTIADGRRPAVIMSYFMDRIVWGLKPFGYHLTNLFLHLLVVTLLFLLVQRLQKTQNPFPAVAAALIFGLHPVLIEAIQVPAFREDLLVAAFTLLYLLAALKKGRMALFALPLLVFALASKESAAMAPILLAWLWGCFPKYRPEKKTASGLLIGSFALVGIFIVLWSMAGSLQAASEEWSGLGLQFPANFLTAPWLWIKTLRILIIPYPLIADYVVSPVTSVFALPFLLGFTVTCAWIAGAVILRRRAPHIAFGMGLMLIAFIPVANLVPLYNPFAERYLYFLTTGFALIMAFLFYAIPKTQIRAALLAIVCAVYAVTTVARLDDWTDDTTLWSKTLKQEPQSARAHTWIGLELKRQGKLQEAFDHFVKANELHPADISALINIGVIYGQQNMLEQSEAMLREAIRRRPNKADAHWNLAMCLYQQERFKEAEQEVEATLKIDPRHIMANRALAEMQYRTENPGPAETPAPQ